MKELAEEFRRVQKVIQADKSVMSDACKSLVLQDFAEKFNEYFDIIGLPRMEITCKNGTFTINVAFQAEGIKKFNILR